MTPIQGTVIDLMEGFTGQDDNIHPRGLQSQFDGRIVIPKSLYGKTFKYRISIIAEGLIYEGPEYRNATVGPDGKLTSERGRDFKNPYAPFNL